VVNLTAVGQTVDGMLWTRAGAESGDLIVVTGPLGGSLLGKHLEFAPRFDVGRRLRSSSAVRAAIDISDGLSIDLLRVADASRCGAIVDLEKVPISDAAHQISTSSGKTPIQHALGDGEDFELLLAVDPDQIDDVFHRLEGVCQPVVCGQFTSRTGLWSRRGSRLQQLPVSGYLHG
jgi:thiamine-monophosphate kinase